MCEECASLPIEEWPADEQTLFRARVGGDVYSAELQARKVKCLAPSTQVGVQSTVQRFFGFLKTHRPEALKQPIEERICASNVAVFVAAMMGLLMGSTLLVALMRLKMAAVRLSPPGTWFGWLDFMMDDVPRAPQGARRLQVIELPILLDIAFERMETGLALIQAQSRANRGRYCSVPEGARLFRDGLMLAFLCVTGLRSNELLGLRLGSSFIPRSSIDASYIINIHHTKSGLGRTGPIHCVIAPMLDKYVEDIRPLFPKARDRDGLWPSDRNEFLGYQALYKILVKLVEGETGEHFSPHATRHILAQFLDAQGAQAEEIAAYLGHFSSNTTERFYWQIRAQIDRRSDARIMGL